MTGLAAMLYREARLRATNATFIFWDVVYPLAYLLVFGVGMSAAMGTTFGGTGTGYSAFFLAGVLGMASFGIASNTAWSLFMDRDNGIFYEMLSLSGILCVGHTMRSIDAPQIQTRQVA